MILTFVLAKGNLVVHALLLYIPHADDDYGNITSQEFARLSPSDDNLYYTNGESSDTVWPGMHSYVV